MILLHEEVEDLVPPSIYFLWWLAKLTNAVGAVAPPPLKVLIGAYQVADIVGTTAAAYDESRGPKRFGSALASPDLFLYEHSALGSSRIL